MHISIKNKYLIYSNYRIKCAVGKRGIGVKEKEGDFITPIGIYRIKFILYRKDRVKNFRTTLKKIPITNKIGWCDDPKSKKYNKLINLPFNFSSEKLFRKDNIYDIVINIKYNFRPAIKSKGSAIFLHLANKKYKPTEGCVAIKKKDFFKILPLIKKKTKISIL